MKRLILTSLSGFDLRDSGRADLVICFSLRFGWGQLPSPDELATYLGARSERQGSGKHWSGYAGRWNPESKARRDLSLVEFCEVYDTVELWFDPNPNDQLQLIWLLDHFRSHPKAAAKLVFRLVDFDLLVESGATLRGYEVFDLPVRKQS